MMHFKRRHFDFLGFTFGRRKSKDRFGQYFTHFTPAVIPYLTADETSGVTG